MNHIPPIIFAVATWRISSLLVNEEGPFGLFSFVRFMAGVYYEPSNAGGLRKVVGNNFFAKVLDCIWCCSMYVGIGWVVLYYIFPSQALYIALPFALSAMAIFINLVVEKFK